MNRVRNRAAFVSLLMFALGSAGCSKKEKKTETKVTAALSKKSSKKAPNKPKIDQELLALSKVVKTEEDFEDQAKKEIVLDTLEAEVDKLSQEITPVGE